MMKKASTRHRIDSIVSQYECALLCKETMKYILFLLANGQLCFLERLRELLFESSPQSIKRPSCHCC